MCSDYCKRFGSHSIPGSRVWRAGNTRSKQQTQKGMQKALTKSLSPFKSLFSHLTTKTRACAIGGEGAGGINKYINKNPVHLLALSQKNSSKNG